MMSQRQGAMCAERWWLEDFLYISMFLLIFPFFYFFS